MSELQNAQEAGSLATTLSGATFMLPAIGLTILLVLYVRRQQRLKREQTLRNRAVDQGRMRR